MTVFRPALFALSCVALASLSTGGIAADSQFEFNIYSPISIDEVTRAEECGEVIAAGNRINASCAEGGRFAVAVMVRELEAEDVRCVISLAPGDVEPLVGHDPADYDSDDEIERCESLVSVAPGGELMGRLTYHVTRAAW